MQLWKIFLPNEKKCFAWNGWFYLKFGFHVIIQSGSYFEIVSGRWLVPTFVHKQKYLHLPAISYRVVFIGFYLIIGYD